MNKKVEVISSTSVLDKTGYEWENNDCVVRAIAIAAEMDYPTAHKWVKEMLSRSDRKGTSDTARKLKDIQNKGIKANNKVLREVVDLINKEYTHKPVKYTVKTFSQKYNKGTYFILVKSHALVIKDGVVYDNPNYQESGFRRPLRSAFKLEEAK